MTTRQGDTSPAAGNAVIFEHVQRELAKIEARVDEKLKLIESRFTESLERSIHNLTVVVSKDIDKRMLESQLALNTVRSDIMAQLADLKEKLIKMHHENEIAIQNLSNDVETFRCVTAPEPYKANTAVVSAAGACLALQPKPSHKASDSDVHQVKPVKNHEVEKPRSKSWLEKYVVPNATATFVALLVTGATNMFLYVAYKMMQEQDQQRVPAVKQLSEEDRVLLQQLHDMIRMLKEQKRSNG